MQNFEILEEKYSHHLGFSKEHAAAVNTGTAALHVALEALNLENDSIVIVPEFTMYASALSVFYSRLQMKFVDCDDNLLINLDKVEKILEEDKERKIKVLMITHVYGRVVDMIRVSSIAKKYNLRVIEDACESQMAITNLKMQSGTFDIGCFSFYRNKIIHAEEGGLVFSRDPNLILTIKDMRSMSFGESHNYLHQKIGFNYRMTNSQAKLVIDSLDCAKASIERRNEIKELLNKKIEKQFQMQDNRSVVWVYDMKHPNADLVVKQLKKAGLNARHSFKPMSAQPLFNKWKNSFEDFKFSQKKSEEVFYLHCGNDLEIDQIDLISKQVNEICKKI